MSEQDERKRFSMEIVGGGGRHYVWSDNRTGLVAKDGPADLSQPVFFVPDESEPSATTPEGWPEGWTRMGATADPG